MLYVLFRDFAKSYSCLRAHYCYIQTQSLIITQINYFVYNYYMFANNIRKFNFGFQFIYRFANEIQYLTFALRSNVNIMLFKTYL